MNNGTCYQNRNLSQSLNQTILAGYYCNCDQLYYGSNCEYKIDVCGNETCSSNGICKDVNSIATCRCFVNYYGDNCELETSRQKLIKVVTSTATIISIASIVLFHAIILANDILNLFCKISTIPKKVINTPKQLAYVS